MVVPLPPPWWCFAQLLSAFLGMVVAEWVSAHTLAEVEKQTVVGSKVTRESFDAGCTELPKMLLRPKHGVRR